MSLNETISANRVHIAFFGVRNAGKSSIVNAVTGQQLSLVSEISGTTTDPVQKAMELLPLGPVVIIDTAGIDDEGVLGEMRIEKTRQILNKTDIAVLVVDSQKNIGKYEEELIADFEKRNLPYIVVYNKSDLEKTENLKENEISVSAVTGEGIENLKEKLGSLAKAIKTEKYIVADLMNEGDTVVLCMPIDESAPKGRIILPQQLTLREILDKRGICICTQDTELADTLENLKEPPRIVITDSQVFGKVEKIVPRYIPLTSFSILMARYKGELDYQLQGANALKELKNGDKILISEGCTHHRQCNDIGTVKMPKWIKDYTNANLEFSFTSGGEFPKDLKKFALVVHCGGCTLNETEMKNRVARAKEQNVPMINYGMAIAQMNGILDRAVEVFEE